MFVSRSSDIFFESVDFPFRHERHVDECVGLKRDTVADGAAMSHVEEGFEGELKVDATLCAASGDRITTV